MKICVCDTDEAYEYLASKGYNTFLCEVSGVNLSECDVLIVSEGMDSISGYARRLIADGARDYKISYIELTPNDIAWRTTKPRHIRWADCRPLSAAMNEDGMPTYRSGIHFLDTNLNWRWRLPELVIAAGPYGCGKSTIMQILAAHFANGAGRELGSGALLCAWEDHEAELKRNASLFAKAHGVNDLLDKIHYVKRNPEDDRLISWYSELVVYHNKRFGTRFFTLDPWNEIDHVKDMRQSETDYVREMMKSFRRLVDKLQIILIIATHVPAKMIAGDGSIEPFKISNAFGSSQFANKADRGICILRTKKFDKKHGHSIIRLDKSKIEQRMGKKGTVAARFNAQNFTLEYDSEATGQVQDIWKD